MKINIWKKMHTLSVSLVIFLVLLVFLYPHPVPGLDPPFLIRDLSNGPKWDVGSGPREFIEFNGFTYFTAWGGFNGGELWKSDGTSSGTEIVSDIFPGAGSSSPAFLIEYDNALYFSADDGTSGEEVWKSDGSSTGTVLLRDINVGSGDAYPESFIIFNGYLWFHADDGIHGGELWRTDGSEVGTILFKDINPGSQDSIPEGFYECNGFLFFRADDGSNGTELWKSDGTPGGTVMVKDINPSGNSAPCSMAGMNGALYFRASDGTYGHELWKSDGTPGGTVMVKDIYPGSTSSYIGEIIVFDNSLYFEANDPSFGHEMWKSDGSTAGTTLLKDINPGTAHGGGDYITVMNSMIYFAASDASHGSEIWKTDGTTSGTVIVRDIRPGSEGSYPCYLTPVDSTLYFRADDGVHEKELWKTDGTEAGTRMVRDINPSGYSFWSLNAASIDHELWFKADDDVHGSEPWKTDGYSTGTEMIGNLYPDTTADILIKDAVNFEGRLLFCFNQGLWISDATFAGTQQISSIEPVIDSSRALFPVGSNVFFTAEDIANGVELWVTDGTGPGTRMVKDIWSGTDHSMPEWFSRLGNSILFAAETTSEGAELWKSDGTEPGTLLVKDINPGGSHSSPEYLTTSGGLVFFQADDGANGRELWCSDGTAVGTVLVNDICSGSADSEPSMLTDVNGLLFFKARDPANGEELWKSDGTSGGTVLVKDICTGSADSNICNALSWNGLLLFQADDGVHGPELWKSDGTSDGTVLVRDISVGAPGSGPSDFIALSDGVVFTAREDSSGTELYLTDGTVVGTVLLKDIYTGRIGSSPTDMVLSESNQCLFFGAADNESGEELWMTYGTPGWTTIACDIQPGIESSAPRPLAVSGDYVYFSAFDTSAGRELWAMELPPTPTPTPSPTPTPTPTPSPTPSPTPFPKPFSPSVPPILGWADHAGASDGGDMAYGIDMLEDGSCFITGGFQSDALFGESDPNETTLHAVAGTDIFVARYNPDGTLEWAKAAGGSDWLGGNSVAAFPDGSCVVTGDIAGFVTFGQGETGQTELTAEGTLDIFLAKYNPDGTLDWAIKAGGSGFDSGKGVSVVPGGNILLTGEFEDTASFDETTDLTSDGNKDIFIACYDSDGSLVWAKRAGGTDSDTGKDVTALPDGSCYVTGDFKDTATFGPGETNVTLLTSPQYSDFFLARYNPDGSLEWAVRAGGSYGTYGYSCSAAGDGSCLAAGVFYTEAVFGPDEPSPITLTGSGSEIFVARYRNDGTVEWAKSAGGTKTDTAYSVAAYADGACLVTGYFGYSSSSSYGYSATFGEGTDELVLDSAGYHDIYLAHYKPDGSLGWVRQAGNTSRDLGMGVALSGSGIGLTGWFTVTSSFGLGEAGRVDVDSYGQADIFLALYGYPSGPTPTPLPPPPFNGMEDNFGGFSLDTSKWELVDGTLPTVSDSSVNMNNAVIRTSEAFAALPLWIEFQDVHYQAMASDSSWMDFGFSVEGKSASCSADLHRSGGTCFEGFGYGYGSLQGWGPLNYYATLPDDTFDMVFLLNQEETQLFMRGSYQTGISIINALTGPVRAYLSADNGASFTVGNVSIHTEPQTNPALCLVYPACCYSYSMGETGVTCMVSNYSTDYSYIKVEKISGWPPNCPLLPLNHYWIISGMEGQSFTADLIFSVEPEDLPGIPIGPSISFCCFRSENDGLSWVEVPCEYDSGELTFTIRNITDFSSWVLGIELNSADSWTLYE